MNSFCFDKDTLWKIKDVFVFALRTDRWEKTTVPKSDKLFHPDSHLSISSSMMPFMQQKIGPSSMQKVRPWGHDLRCYGGGQLRRQSCFIFPSKRSRCSKSLKRFGAMCNLLADKDFVTASYLVVWKRTSNPFTSRFLQPARKMNSQ